MDYFLNQQGKAAGVFPLEELRRRREAGQVSGTDLVWREGMAQWQTLDSVLAEAPPASTNAPPPLPRPPGKQGPSQTVIWGVVVAAIVLMLGMTATFAWIGFKAARSRFRVGGSDSGLEVANQPIHAGTNSLTEAKANQRSRAFRVRQYLEAYRQTGGGATIPARKRPSIFSRCGSTGTTAGRRRQIVKVQNSLAGSWWTRRVAAIRSC